MSGRVTGLVSRGRAVNWLALYETSKLIYKHGRQRWDNLSASERAEIGRMVRKSKGRRANLTDSERDRLWKLVKKAATS